MLLKKCVLSLLRKLIRVEMSLMLKTLILILKYRYFWIFDSWAMHVSHCISSAWCQRHGRSDLSSPSTGYYFLVAYKTVNNGSLYNCQQYAIHNTLFVNYLLRQHVWERVCVWMTDQTLLTPRCLVAAARARWRRTLRRTITRIHRFT